MDSKVERLLNGKNLVFLATTMADGSPQVTPVWGNFADSYILINTAEGRIKHKNILEKDMSFEVIIYDRYQRIVYEGEIKGSDKIWNGINSSTSQIVKTYFYYY